MERTIQMTLTWIFGLVALFLVLYYWVGLRQVIEAGAGAVTRIVATLQGQVLPGRRFPEAYPR